MKIETPKFENWVLFAYVSQHDFLSPVRISFNLLPPQPLPQTLQHIDVS